MITISKSELKARMLKIFRQIEENGEKIIVTSNKVPVIEITPIKKKKNPGEVFADIEQKPVYYEDPLQNTEEEWSEL